MPPRPPPDSHRPGAAPSLAWTRRAVRAASTPCSLLPARGRVLTASQGISSMLSLRVLPRPPEASRRGSNRMTCAGSREGPAQTSALGQGCRPASHCPRGPSGLCAHWVHSSGRWTRCTGRRLESPVPQVAKVSAARLALCRPHCLLGAITQWCRVAGCQGGLRLHWLLRAPCADSISVPRTLRCWTAA